jgi:hypothetical protein
MEEGDVLDFLVVVGVVEWVLEWVEEVELVGVVDVVVFECFLEVVVVE